VPCSNPLPEQGLAFRLPSGLSESIPGAGAAGCAAAWEDRSRKADPHLEQSLARSAKSSLAARCSMTNVPALLVQRPSIDPRQRAFGADAASWVKICG